MDDSHAVHQNEMISILTPHTADPWGLSTIAQLSQCWPIVGCIVVTQVSWSNRLYGEGDGKYVCSV